MMLFKPVANRACGVAVLLTISAVAASCKSRNSNSASKSGADADSDAALAQYEVVDCTPTLCGGDQAAVGVNADEQQVLVAMNRMPSNESQTALDGGGAVPAVTGSAAEAAIQRATRVNHIAGQAIGIESKRSQATALSIGSLLSSLGTTFNQAQSAVDFTTNHIDAKTPEEGTKVLETLKGLSQIVNTNSVGMTPEKRIALMEGLVAIAGDDGWLNRGDLPRLLPVIPNIVGKAADQKIQTGYAEGIAQLAQDHPFVYRRWARRPNGMIGAVVQSRVDEQLNNAYAQKWEAVNAASTRFQTGYGHLMDSLNVGSYYLKNKDGKTYYDPGANVTEAQVAALVESMTGRKLDAILAESDTSDIGNATLPPGVDDALQKVVDKFSFPDGIPVADIVDLSKASNGFTKVVFPKTLMFKLVANDKLEIRRFKGSNPNSGHPPTDTTPGTQSTPPVDEFKCTAVSQKNARGEVMVYLYSSLPAKDIQMKTAQGWFRMLTNYPARPGWPSIQGGVADASWLTTDVIDIKVTLTTGQDRECNGKVYHL